ncbi:MAG: hypothetical protein R6W88_12955, partial [Desulfobacterales bacterium]
MLFAGERGGGRNATTANSLKIRSDSANNVTGKQLPPEYLQPYGLWLRQFDLMALFRSKTKKATRSLPFPGAWTFVAFL